MFTVFTNQTLTSLRLFAAANCLLCCCWICQLPEIDIPVSFHLLHCTLTSSWVATIRLVFLRPSNFYQGVILIRISEKHEDTHIYKTWLIYPPPETLLLSAHFQIELNSDSVLPVKRCIWTMSSSEGACEHTLASNFSGSNMSQWDGSHGNPAQTTGHIRGVH